jgi:hypothetical protein
MIDFGKIPQDKKSENVIAGISQTQSSGEIRPQILTDTFPEVDTQNNLQDLADQSEQVGELEELQNLANTTYPTEQIPGLESGVMNISGQKDESVFLEPSDIHMDAGLSLDTLKSPEEFFFEKAEKIDKKNSIAERNLNPKSAANRGKLEKLKKEGSNMGEEAQIELQGELTTKAKVNRFLGKESTYSKLLRKAEEFNKTKDVSDKQSLLKELKPLARIWLEKHGKSDASDENPDHNERLKRESIYKFLNQTTSNFPEIIEEYKNLQDQMKTFVADPINNRNIFFKSVGNFKNLENLVKAYESTFPPSINLLYVSEMESINEADANLQKSAILKGPSFDTGLGFSISDPEVNFDLISGKYWFAGNLELSFPGIISSKGNAIIEFSSDGNFENIIAEGESCKFTMSGLEFEMTKFNYDYGKQEFSIQEVEGEVNIFGYRVVLNIDGVSFENNKFDYISIKGELPDMDYGFFSLEKSTLIYSKELNAFEAKTSYSFNAKASPLEFEQIVSSGDVQIHWSPQGEKYYAIDNGELKFKLLSQEAEVDKFSYNSKDQCINADELKLNVDLYKFKKSFSGKNITINKEGLDFEKLETEASGHEFNLKIFSLKPESYSLLKDKDAGLSVNAHGSMSLNLPEHLSIEGKGDIEGDVSLGFDMSPPNYRISSGKAEVSMTNPLNHIGDILGDNWTNARYELSAAIPVFPAVSAIFGLYLEYAGRFADKIGATIQLDSENNTITLQTHTTFRGKVEGGVFGGVQGGSQLLIALALLLRAAGEFGFDGKVEYAKDFPIEKEPAEKEFKKDSGLIYSLSGEVKVGAYLDVVATALYFFRKQFSLSLGEKSLGAFEFTNSKTSDPNMGEQALVDRAQLDEAIDPALKAEADERTIEQLLDLDYSHRFLADEKLETMKVIKSAEEGRVLVQEEENQDPSKAQKFNNVALANLQFYNQFIDKRCNWDGIYEVFTSLEAPLTSKSKLLEERDKGAMYLKNKVLPNIQKLGEYTNIAQVFVDHYDEKVSIFSTSYPIEIISSFHTLLLQKSEMLHAVEKMKKDHLHSSFWGDESKQVANIKISSWFGKSNYEDFAKDYLMFREVLIRNRNIIEEVDAMGEEIAFRLVQNHQRSIENA